MKIAFSLLTAVFLLSSSAYAEEEKGFSRDETIESAEFISIAKTLIEKIIPKECTRENSSEKCLAANAEYKKVFVAMHNLEASKRKRALQQYLQKNGL